MEAAKDAFLKAYDEHADALLRYAFFKVTDRELAADLVQETFTKTWVYIAGGGQVSSPKAFLYRTLGNLIIDEYRKKKTVSLDTLAEDGFDPGFDDTDTWTDRLDGEKAIELLSKLPASYRDAIYLRYVEELSLDEIAALSGESKNAVTVRMHRGLKKLKELYDFNG